jgi:hypothetical protein
MGKALSVALFIILAMQIIPPVPGQQTGATSNGSNKAAENRQSDKSATSPSITAPALQPKDSRDKGQGVASEDKEQAIKLTSIPTITLSEKKKTWIDYAFDWGPWVFRLILVFVGVLGVFLARRTLRTLDRQADLMETQATLMERQANLTQAAMTQWVSVVNWQSSLFTMKAPSPQLVVQFDIANESSFPLTAKADFRFFGNLPNALRFAGAFVLFPRKPNKCEVHLYLTEEQSKEYVDTALRIAVHGEIAHVGVAKERSPLMSIRGNLVCGMKTPTHLEYESISMTPMAPQRKEGQADQKAN